jgi:ribosome-binding factor A
LKKKKSDANYNQQQTINGKSEFEVLLVVSCRLLVVKRLESLSEIIKTELAQMIMREIELPEGILLTITRAEITDDKQQAKIRISLLGGTDAEKTQREILDMLSKRTPLLQGMLNRKMRTRPVPRIRFLIDEEELKRQRVEELLAKTAENQ